MTQLDSALANLSVACDGVTAVVLAGGSSSRLGVDKCSLVWGTEGVALLDLVVERLREVATEIMVVRAVGTQGAGDGVRVVVDDYPGAGPLGGICTGLSASAHEYSLVVAVDMPFLSLGLLRYLVGVPRDYDVLIPRIATLLEPLHAIYSKNCIPHMRALLRQGARRVVDILPKVRVKYIEEAEARAFDSELLCFFNINTVEQLERARRIGRLRERQS